MSKGRKLSCGCVADASGYGYCDKCTRALRERVWRNMSEGRKEYDRHFDPVGSRILDDSVYGNRSECCSCHINPPCSYCVNQGDEE